MAEIDEVILSLNYQPRRIEEVFGDGRDVGIKIRYVVEPTPLGTAGGVKYAARGVDDTLVVFNGDPSAYGLVETDEDSNILRFLEKPKADEITCDTINAGIYILEPSTFDRIPDGVAWSIERSFFPSFVERREIFMASIYRDYWIDIGTPDKYIQVHRDIMDGRYSVPPFNGQPSVTWVSPAAKVDPGSRIEAPSFVDEGCVIKAGARIGPYTVLGKNSHVDEDANVSGAIVWPDTRIGREAEIGNAIIGRGSRIGRNASVQRGVLGDKTDIADYSRL